MTNAIPTGKPSAPPPVRGSSPWVSVGGGTELAEPGESGTLDVTPPIVTSGVEVEVVTPVPVVVVPSDVELVLS